jgi:hypothetical protein
MGGITTRGTERTQRNLSRGALTRTLMLAVLGGVCSLGGHASRAQGSLQGSAQGYPVNLRCQLATPKSIACDLLDQGPSYCGSHHGSACTSCRGGAITGQLLKCLPWEDASTCSAPPSPSVCDTCPGDKYVGQCLDDGHGVWTCQNCVASGACAFEICDACTPQ